VSHITRLNIKAVYCSEARYGEKVVNVLLMALLIANIPFNSSALAIHSNHCILLLALNLLNGMLEHKHTFSFLHLIPNGRHVIYFATYGNASDRRTRI